MTKKHECQLRQKRATRKNPFLFTSSGLSNVYLTGIKYEECDRCKKIAGMFPRVQELLDVLAYMVVIKPSALRGDEIRFLRKWRIRQSTAMFARTVGVSREQLSRWENQRNYPERSADKLIRLLADTSLREQITCVNYRKIRKEFYRLRFEKGKWYGDFEPFSPLPTS